MLLLVEITTQEDEAGVIGGVEVAGVMVVVGMEGYRGAGHQEHGTGRGGRSVWGQPAPYPTSVVWYIVCLQTLCSAYYFDLTQWSVSAWYGFSGRRWRVAYTNN